MRVIARRVLIGWAAILALVPVLAAQQPPPAKDAAEYLDLLERPERVEGLQVPRVIETLRVQRGQTVADLGSGSGLFTRPLARAVGDTGKVYAVDIDEALLLHVARTAASDGLGNITTVLARPDDSLLPEPVDLILVCDTLHHIGNPAAYLERLRSKVKAGGRVAIIDFREGWPPGHEQSRYTVDQLDGWMSAAGFIRYESHDFLENTFFVIYGTPRLPGHE